MSATRFMSPEQRQALFRTIWRIAVPLAWFTLSLTAQEHLVVADDSFLFFRDPDVDFWKKPSEQPVTVESSNENGLKPSPGVPQTGHFAWNKYLDPKNDQFFREGDYTPPAPFMEIARNPSDENIKNWFHYLELKNQLTRNLQSKLEEYAKKSPGGPSAMAQAPAQLSNSPAIPTLATHSLRSDASRYRLRLYFDSKCPHCQQMMGTLRDLTEQGYWVELKQVDSDVSARSHIPLPVSGASAAELKQYQIEAVPALLIGDLKTKTFFKLQGYQPTPTVLEAIADHQSKFTTSGDKP